MERDINVIPKNNFSEFILRKIGRNQDNKRLFDENYILQDGTYIIREGLDQNVKDNIKRILKGIGYLPFSDIIEIVSHIRNLEKKFILLYAHNGTGKTRLSMDFKDTGKEKNENGEIINRDTLYFNAFTEDLFSWDNDLDNDTQRRLLINKNSAFISGVRDLDMENKIRPLIHRYCNFNFLIDYEYRTNDGRSFWATNFIREIIVDEHSENVEYIKISRGEENLFIWCFFLAVAQLVIERHEDYRWVKFLYIDDPVSSLDENNAIALAHHLSNMLKIETNNVRTIISTHHSLFFNVLSNELSSANKYFISKRENVYWLTDVNDSPFIYHVSLIQSLHKAISLNQLYTYHFNVLRIILEKAANFHGFNGFQDCIILNDDDDEHTLHTRMVNIFNHGAYSLFEPMEMGEENKGYFKQIFNNFLTNYKFNEKLFEETV